MMGWGKEFANLTSWEGPVVAAFGGFTNGIDVFSGGELEIIYHFYLLSILSCYLRSYNVDFCRGSRLCL
jgi:hypothetical protein